MSYQDTDDDRQDLEYAQNRVAEVNESAAKAVSRLAGIESSPSPNGSLRFVHSELCTTLMETTRAISRVEQAIAALDDGYGTPMPRQITSEHADRFDELYDGPVYYLALQLLEKNRREFLQRKPDTYGAEQVERHGLTENQRKWLTDLSDAWQAKDHVYDPRTIDHAILSDVLRTVVTEARNENWGNTRVNLEEALEGVAALEKRDSDGEQVGLYDKYSVRKDGQRVTDCFVLEPGDDPAAREALRTYAAETEDDDLAADLAEWTDDLEETDSK
ncbi:hypothetical protein [Natrinema sp. DC36]|uniref:hypothetical protein n=1 Tax=Natrinema sp. DC36 TaxID=2878680 RepID=UPI001CF06D65|nr:hypothetical protein [Natrinema sp. DC36]